jgi:hypothetical protein
MERTPRRVRRSEKYATEITFTLHGGVASSSDWGTELLDADGDLTDDCVRVDGANSWLFPVDSGGSYLVVSAGNGREKHIAAIDPLNVPSGGSLRWTTVVSNSEIETLGMGATIADHWHVYAHGRHWLTIQTDKFGYLWLIQVDQSDDETTFTRHLDGSDPKLVEILPALNVVPLYLAGTNDHFMVDMVNGVAIAVKQGSADVDVDGTGTCWFHVKNRIAEATDTADRLTYLKSASEIAGNSGDVNGLTHTNGGSALRAEFSDPDAPLDIHEFHLFVPQTIQSNTAGSPGNHPGVILHLVATDAFTTATTIVAASGNIGDDTGQYQGAMATTVLFDNGWFVVTYRRIDYLQAQSSDSGEIVRDLFEADGTLHKREVLATTNNWNRPHTTRFTNDGGDFLITCFCSDNTQHAYMRVDDISCT